MKTFIFLSTGGRIESLLVDVEHLKTILDAQTRGADLYRPSTSPELVMVPGFYTIVDTRERVHYVRVSSIVNVMTDHEGPSDLHP